MDPASEETDEGAADGTVGPSVVPPGASGVGSGFWRPGATQTPSKLFRWLTMLATVGVGLFVRSLLKQCQ